MYGYFRYVLSQRSGLPQQEIIWGRPRFGCGDMVSSTVVFVAYGNSIYLSICIWLHININISIKSIPHDDCHMMIKPHMMRIRNHRRSKKDDVAHLAHLNQPGMGRRSSQKDRETRVGRGSRASQQPMTLGRLETWRHHISYWER